MESVEKYQTKAVEIAPEIIASIVLNGDVSKLNPIQKTQYYNYLCSQSGLNPAFQPFQLLKLNGKEIFYATKTATQQLCETKNISTAIVKKERMDGLYIVTARATIDNGRFTDEDGAVRIDGLQGDALANALMKATTKAKRRAVLSLCSIGMMDETELETVPNAEPVNTPLAESKEVAPKLEAQPEQKKEKIDCRKEQTVTGFVPIPDNYIIEGKQYGEWKSIYRAGMPDEFVFGDRVMSEGKQKGHRFSSLSQNNAQALYHTVCETLADPKYKAKHEQLKAFCDQLWAYASDDGTPF